MDTKRALVLGGVSYNTMAYLGEFPQPEAGTLFANAFHETVGSTGSGKALNLSKLGMDVTLYGVIGEDYYSERIIEYFRRQPLTFLYDSDPAGTERHVNLMDAAGKRISVILRSATPEPETGVEKVEPLIEPTHYVVLNISSYCRRFIPLIKARGSDIWCDIHDYDGRNDYHRDFIDAADYLFMSSDAMPNYRPFMERAVGSGKSLVVCTHGSEGSTALTPEGSWIETPIATGYPVKDTNGAGDAFFAGYLYAHSKGYPVETALRMGAVVAGLCVTSFELALPELTPTLAEEEYERHYGALP